MLKKTRKKKKKNIKKVFLGKLMTLLWVALKSCKLYRQTHIAHIQAIFTKPKNS